MKTGIGLVAVAICALKAAYGDFAFDAGADLRIRQEIFDHVPQMQGGMTGRPGMGDGKYVNHFRIRPRVWMELKADEHWRIYTRLTDEFRHGIVNGTRMHNWPDELEVDNLFIEGKGLFDGKLDLLAGRRDIIGLYGLEHIFFDGTAGDGSRTAHADMLCLTWHFTEDSQLDVFAMMNRDREYMRVGTHRSYYTQLTGFGGNDTEMNDWAYGAIWSSKISFIDYQVLAIQKNTESFHRQGVKHPNRQVNLFGTKFVPHWTENLSTPIELYGQVGRNGDGDDLVAWSTYTSVLWKDMSRETWRPYFESALHIMSGDSHAATEDGGNHAWDPMWYRAIWDSEMFLYGALYGVGWWSNLYNFRNSFGFEIGPGSKIAFISGPMFAQEKDGCGGGDGRFKGYLNQVRWDFPLFPCDSFFGCRVEGFSGPAARFQMFGHILLEHFVPGDYYDTDKCAYFVRWQVDFKF